LGGYVTDENLLIANVITLSAVTEIRFAVDYTALFFDKVKWHVIWTGPNIYRTYDFDSWFTTKSSQYYWAWVSWTNPTYKTWPKGTYSCVFVCEGKKEGSGAERVARFVFKIR